MRILPIACLTAGLVVLSLTSLPLAAGQAAGPYVPKQSDRPEPVTGDEPGFKPIFDGRSLDGWEGDPNYWRVEAATGTLVGEITPATVIKSNTFIIWRGGQPKDFELKLEYRITPEGNSGINYRSVVVPDPVTPANTFAMRGYQCDLDGRKRYPGNNYEEKAASFSRCAVNSRASRADVLPCFFQPSAIPKNSRKCSPTIGTPCTSSRVETCSRTRSTAA